ncbi:MAG: hypothetical protein WCA96_08525 [Methylocella sp.]
MNVTKIVFYVIGAMIISSAAAFQATARTADETDGTRIGWSVSEIAQSAIVGERVAASSQFSASNSQIALNPQPLPPGFTDPDDDRY